MGRGPSATAYVPPNPDEIVRRQNELGAIRLLLAQRRLYDRAKRWALLRAVGFSLIAVAAPLITAAYPKGSVALGALAGLWIFLAKTVFASIEQRYAARAAEVQEQFDLQVFAMPSLALRDPRVMPEEVSRLVGSDAEAAAAALDESLHDWYPVERGVSGLHAVAIAQRANAAYSERLLNANASVWLSATIGWSLIAVALGLVLGLDLVTFLLGVAAPLLPALLDVYDQWRITKTAGGERRALAESIEAGIRGTHGATVTPEELLVWQDQMYGLRRKSPQVPNLVYGRTRTKNERAMGAAAADLAAAARAAARGE